MAKSKNVHENTGTGVYREIIDPAYNTGAALKSYPPSMNT